MLKNAFRKVKNKLGFTMVEVLVVVGIIAITTGIAIPTLISVNRSTKLTKHNDYAKAIYLAAQDNLNQMRAAGELGMVATASEKDLGAQHMSGSGYFCSYSKAGAEQISYDLIVPGSIDHDIRNEEVIVEYNPKSGVVYSVFYTEDDQLLTYYNTLKTNQTIRGEEGTDKERKNLGVGYYSVKNTDGLAEAEFEVVHATSELVYVNGQEGYLTLKLPMMFEGQTTTFFDNYTDYVKGLEVELTVTGENGGEYTKTYIPNTVTPPEGSDATPVEFRYVTESGNGTELVYYALWVDIPMDSLWIDGSFTEKPENQGESLNTNRIAAGDNVTVTADITFYPTAYSDEEKEKDKNKKDDPIIVVKSSTLAGINPMFHSLTKDPKADENSATPYILAISNGRHLQNLQYLKPAFAQKLASIVFTDPEAEEQTSGTNQNGTNQPQTTAEDSDGPVLDWALTAEHYKSSNTLQDKLPRDMKPIDFYGLSTGNTADPNVRKLVIDGNKVTIKNLTIDKASGTDTSTENSAGTAGLFGKLYNVDVRDIRLENPNVVADNSRATGALAGETYHTLISGCSVSNNTSTQNHTRISGKTYVGGLIGSAQNGTIVTNCVTSAYVNGAGGKQSAVGGLVGFAQNAQFSGCLAKEAEVESGSGATTNYEKHVLGGLVGWAGSGSVFEDCSTYAATRVHGFQDTKNDAGGFVGYAVNAVFGDAQSAALNCESYAQVSGSANSDASNPIPNNNLGGFVGRSASSTYYHPKVIQYHLPQYTQDAGGFAGVMEGDDVYSLYVEFNVPDGETQSTTETVANFGGIASICSRNDNASPADLAHVTGANVEIKTRIQNVSDRAAGGFAKLDEYSVISNVHVNQSEIISSKNGQIAGFAVDVGSRVEITGSSFRGALIDYGSGFVRNNIAGIIDRCYANPQMSNGFAFVRDNDSTVKNCFAWAKGTDNTVAVDGAKYSYFGSYDSSYNCTGLKFYEAEASTNITDTEALADPWAVTLLNGANDTDWWTSGETDGYPYPMLLKSTDSAEVMSLQGISYPNLSEGSYPYALVYKENYGENGFGVIVVSYNENKNITGITDSNLSNDKTVTGTEFYLCHRTQAGLGTVYCDHSFDNFDTVMDSLGLNGFNRLYTVYQSMSSEFCSDLNLNTSYPLIQKDGQFYGRIRTAEQFAAINNSEKTFYVDRSFTAAGSLSGFSGKLIGVGNPVITVNNPLFTTLSGEISGISVAADITGGENIGAIAGTMTGGSISGCSVSGSVSGGNYVGGVVGHITDGTFTNVSSNVSVVVNGTNGGMFAGYVEDGEFYNCNSTTNTNNLPFANFAMQNITGTVTHKTKTGSPIDIQTGNPMYLSNFSNLEPWTSTVQTVKATVDQYCRFRANGTDRHPLTTDGIIYYNVQSDNLLVQNVDGSGYTAQLTEQSLTYKELLSMFSADTTSCETNYYAPIAGNTYERISVSYSKNNDVYTFTLTSLADNSKSKIIKNVENLEAEVGTTLYTVDNSFVEAISDGYYQITFDSCYIAYNSGTAVLLNTDTEDIVSTIWTRSEDNNKWLSYSDTDATDLTIEFDTDNSIANLVTANTLTGSHVHAQNVGLYYNHTNLGQTYQAYVPTT